MAAPQLQLVADEPVATVEYSAPKSATAPLVPAKRVEVRILRELPDLVGELQMQPQIGAVEFVAYLATHGYRATTTRLRDALGTPRSQASRSGKSVWTAAGLARRTIGVELLPQASGNQLYLLSEDVSCDWIRFGALLAIAQRPDSDRATTRQALTEALRLVAGIPGASSRRFSYFDVDGLLADVARDVSIAAHLLATLATDDGSAELARWAIAKGRLLSPRSDELAADEARLEAAELVTEPPTTG